MASGVVLSRNNQTQQNLFKFGFLSPVWALPVLLRVLACTAVQSAHVGASCPAAGVGMCGGAIGLCGRFLPCCGCWHVRRCNRPVLALPVSLLVLGCTAVQSAHVGASCPAAGVGMCGDAIGPCGRFLPCCGCWHVRRCNRPVLALPVSLLVLGCTAVQSARVGAFRLAAGSVDACPMWEVLAVLMPALCGKQGKKWPAPATPTTENVSVWLMLVSLATPARLR